MNRRANALAAAFVAAVLIGQVRDATTGQPLPNVTIAVGSKQTKTDAHGRYRLSGVSAGTHTVDASSDDVPPQHRSVRVGSGQTEFDFKVCSTTLDYACGGVAPGPG